MRQARVSSRIGAERAPAVRFDVLDARCYDAWNSAVTLCLRFQVPRTSGAKRDPAEPQKRAPFERLASREEKPFITPAAPAAHLLPKPFSSDLTAAISRMAIKGLLILGRPSTRRTSRRLSAIEEQSLGLINILGRRMRDSCEAKFLWRFDIVHRLNDEVSRCRPKIAQQS